MKQHIRPYLDDIFRAVKVFGTVFPLGVCVGGGGGAGGRFVVLVSAAGSVVCAYTVNFANNDCGYIDNLRIMTEFPCAEQSHIQL